MSDSPEQTVPPEPEPSPAPDPNPPVADDDATTQISTAKGLFAAGATTLPLGLGVGFGYWGADHEVPATPMIGAVLVLWLFGLAAMIVGQYLLGPGLGRKKGHKRLVVLSILAVLVAGARIGVDAVDAPKPLTSLGNAYGTTFQLDARQYRELDRALGQVVTRLSELDAFAAVAGEPAPLTAEEEAEVLAAWVTFLNSAAVLDRIRRFHEDYMYFDLSRLERDQHVRSYCLTFASELALYEHTTELVDLLALNGNVSKFLDTPHPKAGLAEGTVGFVREELGGLTDFARVLAGKQYLAALDLGHGSRAQANANGYGWLWDAAEGHLRRIETRSSTALATKTVANDLAPLGRKLKELVYPVQAKVAAQIADVRVRRPGRYLITREQLDAMRAKVAPGDVMIGRKNWYLSNVGLPGFWPHAFLYVGDEAELAKAFDDDAEVRAWVEREGGRDESFTAYLARTFPDAWRDRAAAPADEPLIVIEAISEGVLQNSLAHASGDYLGVLRPHLAPWVKARAIARAFGYLGRAYDFDFDFATDHTLVCSEVVWRSYRPLKDEAGHGLRIDAVVVAGRHTLPPNEFARLYRDEAGKEGAQLEFVYFLEGVEKDQVAVVQTEAAFRETVDRSKWDVAQR
jgi:hypothetical protein